MNANLDAHEDCLKHLFLKPRHKWFCLNSRLYEHGWFGPHDSIEAAIRECASYYGTEYPIFVTQGYKLTKAKLEEWGEWGAELDWKCDLEHAIEVRLPNNA